MNYEKDVNMELKIITDFMEKVTDKLTGSKIIFIICFSLSYKQVLFDINVLNNLSKKSFSMNLSLLLSIHYIFSVFFKSKSLVISYIFLVVISILMFSNAIFYRCYGDFITLGIITGVRQLPAIKSSINFFFNRIDLLYLLDLPFILLFLKYCSNEYKSLRSKVFNLLISLFFCILLFGYTSFKVPNLASVVWSRTYLYYNYGFVAGSFIDSFNYIKNNVNFTNLSGDKKQIIDNNFKATTYNTSKYKDKNLIMIQVESLQQFVINKKYNEKEITPRLNSLIKESLYFDNCYHQISLGHTADAELLTNTSLYPLEDSVVYMNKYNNDFIALPRIMNSLGYNSFVIHGNEGSFWNRNLIYNRYGFNKFYSIEKLEHKDVLNMGLTDDSLFNQSFDIINKNKSPFYTFIITLSSHGPFKVNNNFCKTDNSLLDYYNAINYTDKQIGEFIARLRYSGMLDNSIILIYGDHNAITPIDKDTMEKEVRESLDKTYQWQNYQKVPLIIRVPNGEIKGIKHDSVGQIDVLPTLLNLYGISGIKHFGTSVLDYNNHLVVLRNGSYVYGKEFYDSQTNTTYNIDSGKVVNNDSKKIAEADAQLKASDYIIRYNYFK